MANCKLCQTRPCDVGAHIVPRWAYRDILTNGPALIIPTDPNRYIGRSRKGEFDRNLICSTCEQLFSPLDRFGCQFFRDSDWSQNSFQKLGATPHKEYWLKKLPGEGYQKLHKFVISLLWRISATDRPSFNDVALGSREQILKSMLLQDNCSPNIFPFRLTRYFTPRDIPILNPEAILTNPQSAKIKGYTCVRIPLFGFEIFISTDSRESPLTVPELSISPESIPVLGTCFTGSPDIKTIQQMIQSHRQ